jgi:hypothetical protein
LFSLIRAQQLVGEKLKVTGGCPFALESSDKAQPDAEGPPTHGTSRRKPDPTFIITHHDNILVAHTCCPLVERHHIVA